MRVPPLPAVRPLNEALAAHATAAMTSMWCAYLFMLLALSPLAWPGVEAVVSYVSQSVIQLVALPLIMVGTAVMSRAQDARAAEDHAALMEELSDVREILADVRVIMEAVAKDG